jgi:FtsH-binding integral membrane protein
MKYTKYIRLAVYGFLTGYWFSTVINWFIGKSIDKFTIGTAILVTMLSCATWSLEEISRLMSRQN